MYVFVDQLRRIGAEYAAKREKVAGIKNEQKVAVAAYDKLTFPKGFTIAQWPPSKEQAIALLDRPDDEKNAWSTQILIDIEEASADEKM